MLAQIRRLLIPLAIRDNNVELCEKGRIRFYLDESIVNINKMLEAISLKHLSKVKIQTAVNSVVKSSNCYVVMELDGNFYIDIQVEDAKKVSAHINRMTPSISEKESSKAKL